MATAASQIEIANLRLVWKDMFVIAKKLKACRLKWWIQEADYDTPRESTSASRLVAQWTHLRSCCVEPAKVRKLLSHQQDNAAIFDTPAGLLRARLVFQSESEFQNRATSYAQSAAIKSNKWNDFDLCHSCCASAMDLSERTIRRRAKPRSLLKRSRSTAWKSDVVLTLVTQMVDRAQYGPNAHGRPSRILPYTTQENCRTTLVADHIALNQIKEPFDIAASTFRRALRKLARERSININIHKSKSVARCAVCEEYEGAKVEAEKTGNASTIYVETARWNAHQTEHNEQRNFYEDIKRTCLKSPHMRWLLTLDGMDTSKTSLPSYARVSKHPDVLATLALRVVGAFVFGGPVPCMALTSFDDVQSKGGNASVTAIEKILDTQWNAMDIDNHAVLDPVGVVSHAEPISPCRGSSLGDGSSAAEPPVASSSIKSSASTCTLAAFPATRPDGVKVPFIWPRSLHVVFDNTAGDCKNTTTFRFLGSLVAAGVFKFVSVSTLMVGHTHDIVDQLFSVWSKQLGLADTSGVANLEEMHALFRKNYESQIYALAELMQTFEAEKKRKGGSKRLEPKIARHLVDVANAIGVEPLILLQQFSINADEWIGSKSIDALASANIFHICKEVDTVVGTDEQGASIYEEAVVMYSRHLARSHITDRDVPHPYTGLPDGPYAARFVLLRKKEYPTADPTRCPPRYVPTDGPRSCSAQHVVEKNMSVERKRVFDAQLDKFEDNFKKLNDQCATCAKLQTVLQKIGPIHRPTPEEKKIPSRVEEHQRQVKAKNLAMKNIKNHSRDVVFKAAHAPLDATDWWVKWQRRVVEVIHPYYVKQGISVQLSEADRVRLCGGRKSHPHSLPAEAGAPALMRQRGDIERMRTGSPPAVGDLVIARSSLPQQPFWVGEIVDPSETIDSVNQEEQEEKIEEQCTARAAPGAKRCRNGQAKSTAKSTPLDLTSPAALKKLTVAQLLSVCKSQKLVTVDRHGKTQLKSNLVAIIIAHLKDNPQAAPEVAANITSPSQPSGKRKRMADTSSEEESSASESSESSGDDLAAPRSKPVNSNCKKKQRTEDSDADDEEYQDPPTRKSKASTLRFEESKEDVEMEECKSSDKVQPAAAAASSTQAAAAAAHATPHPSRFAAPNRLDRAAKAPRLERTLAAAADQNFRVQWLTWLTNKDSKEIDPVNPDNCEAFMREQGKLEDWNRHVTSVKAGKFGRVPQCLVDRFRPLQWCADDQRPQQSWTNVQSLIWWGSKDKLLSVAKSKRGRIMPGAWNAIVHDLTECKDIAAGIGAREDSVAADAAAAAHVPQDKPHAIYDRNVHPHA